MLWRLAVTLCLVLQPAVLAGGHGHITECITPNGGRCCMAAGEAGTACCASPVVCGCSSEVPHQPPAGPQRGSAADHLLLLLQLPSSLLDNVATWSDAAPSPAMDDLPPVSAHHVRAVLCIWLT
jgi:hypothetical protein